MRYSERVGDTIKAFLALLSDIDDMNSELLERITICDRKTQDILHGLEFERFSASAGDSFARKLKEVRIVRREAKDERELISYFKKFSDEHKKLTITFTGILHSMRQITQNQQNRTYHPREPEIFEDAI